MALAAAGGVAHGAFFALFAWRVIGRDGFGTIGWVILALVALAGLGLNFLGYWLIKRGDGPLRRWGVLVGRGVHGARRDPPRDRVVDGLSLRLRLWRDVL